METATLLQETYIQKSRVFLLPLTGMKKDKRFIPCNTYISSDDLISEVYPHGISRSDQILIITFPIEYEEMEDKLNNRIKEKLKLDKDTLSGWEEHKIRTLMSNPKFIGFHKTEEDLIFTFDLSKWSSDWNCFIKGRYSLFGDDAKDEVIKFRWPSLSQIEQRKLYCYLYPYKEECLKAFAEDLDLSIRDLAQVKELCSKPNFSLEDYKFNLKKNEG